MVIPLVLVMEAALVMVVIAVVAVMAIAVILQEDATIAVVILCKESFG